jgi:hypothetical protein
MKSKLESLKNGNFLSFIPIKTIAMFVKNKIPGFNP